MTAIGENALQDRHALVSGAGGGIGRAIATGLVSAGAKVTLAGRNRERLEALADTLPAGRTYVLADFDVTDAAAISKGAQRAREVFGPVSILVNNAGAAPSAPFDKTSPELWASVIAANLTSVFLVTQAFLADIRAYDGPGRIINIASTAGLIGYRYISAYAAAKHGVIGLTRSLALELAKTKISVNAVCPGFTNTPLIERGIDEIAHKTGRSRADALTELIKANPRGRLITPEEVADTVLWLASPGASAITGQAIAVAGGEIFAG